jgi:hypothetical protein
MPELPAIDRIPIGHSVNYAVRGAPEIADEYNAERTIDPIEITLVYRSAPDSQLGRISAYIKGWWMQSGKRVPMDKPVGRWLYGGPEHWPAWLAEEARLHDPDVPPQDDPHSCPNCDGIDPDTCLMNPSRPAEQCPRSEFDGYGLQCQKEAGHNLCTFEMPGYVSAEDGS